MLLLHISRVNGVHPQDTLEPDELAWLSQRRHMPQAVSQVLTETLWRIRMPDFQKATLDTQVLDPGCGPAGRCLGMCSLRMRSMQRTA